MAEKTAEKIETVAPKGPTKRVVLMGVEAPAESLRNLIPPEREGLRELIKGENVTVWVEVAQSEGDKRQAVKDAVGETPGLWRAPSERSWKGGVGFRPPEQERLEGFGFD